jgi:hypothetical protein
MAQDNHLDERFFEYPFEELNKIINTSRYHRHPSAEVLRKYVQGLIPDEGDLWESSQSASAEIPADWLEGNRGWTLSAVSLHVLSCKRCRRRVAAIRSVEDRRLRMEKILPKWRGIQKALVSLWLRPSLLRQSTALLILAVLMAILLVFLSQPPPSTSPPIHFEKGRISGSGLG